MKSLDFRIWALLSAVFAGATAVLAKKGVEHVSSNLALAIRVVVILIFAWGIVLATGESKLSGISSKTWLFLFLSGLATGASWLCYFQALKLGPISKVAPIDKLSFALAVTFGFVFLGERPSLKLVLGCVIVIAGVIVTLL
jgi:transporter family protein